MKPIFTFFKSLIISRILLLIVALVLSFQSFSSSISYYSDESDIIKINPAYKIKRFADGKVIAYTSLENGGKVVHDFTDFNADILLAAIRKQKLNSVTLYLSRKYHLSEDDCRRKVKHSINVLEEWDIILRRDKFLVKK